MALPVAVDRQAVVSTHSRLKAAGIKCFLSYPGHSVSTHSRLKAAGVMSVARWAKGVFQHTAA